MRPMPAARCSGASASERHGRRAVRRRHDAPRHVAQVVGVDLGDHERHVGLHAERGRLVDDPGAGGGGARRPLERERVVDVDDHEVEAVEAAVAQHLGTRPRRRRTATCDPPSAATRTRAARRPGTPRSRAVAASRCRRARSHRRGRRARRRWRMRAVLTRLPRARTRRAARGPPARRRPRCTTHEIRIVDVEIISMFTLSAASVSNICAATPGLRLHAGADERDPADRVVVAGSRRLRSRRPSSRPRRSRGRARPSAR